MIEKYSRRIGIPITSSKELIYLRRDISFSPLLYQMKSRQNQVYKITSNPSKLGQKIYQGMPWKQLF
jgi:hypothetical protein